MIRCPWPVIGSVQSDSGRTIRGKLLLSEKTKESRKFGHPLTPFYGFAMSMITCCKSCGVLFEWEQRPDRRAPDSPQGGLSVDEPGPAKSQGLCLMGAS